MKSNVIKNQKISNHMFNKTLDQLIRCGRRDRFNISITFRGGNTNTSAKNILESATDKIIFEKSQNH